MWLLLSGEGVSDIGTCNPASDYCEIPELKVGAMAWFVDQCIEEIQGYEFSHIESHLVRFISKSKLTKLSKSLSSKKKLGLRGAKQKSETLYYQRNARALAIEAKKLEEELNDSVLAVLFRDADGTQSSSRGEWQAKWNSMLKGFQEEDFKRGVPMIPKPKSEAWLLCALKNNYQHCENLENESGNDDSNSSLKSQLDDVLNGHTSATEIADKVHTKEINVLQIDMPSLNAFKTRLSEVLNTLT
ncbi:MAG: hypothetical protein GQ569_06390 [Methylococcaceae bacterium]|nr:hypothetical protein [Methylococcaceae bacterium]